MIEEKIGAIAQYGLLLSPLKKSMGLISSSRLTLGVQRHYEQRDYVLGLKVAQKKRCPFDVDVAIPT